MPWAEKIFNQQVCLGDDLDRSPNGPRRIITREKEGRNLLLLARDQATREAGKTISEGVEDPSQR